MAKGITFGNTHTSSFGIYLSSVEIGKAEIKEHKIDIPGADGSLDLTEYFGCTCFDNRKITFEFAFPQRNAQLLSAYSAFQTAIHGKYFDRIILDDDKPFRYVGRVSVGELKKAVISKVTVECDCKPYKYSIVENSVNISVTDIEFPTGWVYGTVEGNSIFTSLDTARMASVVGKRSFESEYALRADYNFDGIVTDIEKKLLDDYMNEANAYYLSMEFKNFALANAAFYETMRNCKRQIIDFGNIPVAVKFSRLGSDHTRLWELRIDNISQFGLRGISDYTVNLSGEHEIMILTANTNTTGDFSVTWNSAGVF